MLALFLSALGIFLLVSAITSVIPRIPRIVQAMIGAYLLSFGFSALRSPHRFQVGIRDLLLINSGQIILAIIAIILGLALYWWMAGHRTVDPNNTFIKWYFLALVILGFVAVLEPHLPGLAQKMTGIKTPWFETQLRTTEKVAKRTEADYYGEVMLVRAEQLQEIIERGRKVTKLKLQDYHEQLKRSTNQTTKGALEDEIKGLNKKLESIDQFTDFLKKSGLRKFLDNTEKRINKGEIQETRAESLYWAGALDKLVEKKEFDIRCRDANPNGIPKSLADDLPMIAENTAYFDLTRLLLSWYAGNRWKARSLTLKALEKPFQDFERFSLHSLLARMIIFSRDQAVNEGVQEAIYHYEQALQLVQALQREISRITEDPGLKKEFEKLAAGDEENKKLKTSLEKLELGFKNSLAYQYARQEILEGRAREYANDLNKAMTNDPDTRAPYLDTVGYVKLRFWKDSKELREAILYFEEAENLLLRNFEKIKNDPDRTAYRERVLIQIEIIRAHKAEAHGTLF